MRQSRSRLRRGRAPWRGLATFLLLAGLATVWLKTPLRHYLSPRVVYDEIASMEPGLRTASILLGVFVAGGLVSFPVMILSGATAIAFGFPWGLVYSVAGCVGSALAVYLVGRFLWPDAEEYLERSHRLRRIRHELLERQGIFAMALLRMIPVAPYSLINVVAGMIHFPVKDYLVGTVAGLTPAILATAVLADEVRAAMRDEAISISSVVLAIGLKVLVLILCFLLGARRKPATEGAPSPG